MELLNLFPLEGMELTLKGISLSGIDGVAPLLETIGLSWVHDITQRQMHRCLASINMPPLRPIMNIGSGAADLILLVRSFDMFVAVRFDLTDSPAYGAVLTGSTGV